jgi:hypothetical protein
MNSDIFSPMLEGAGVQPKAPPNEMHLLMLKIMLEMLKSGGETTSDPMAELMKMSGGDVWQK